MDIYKIYGSGISQRESYRMCRIPLSTIPSIRERRTFGQTRVKFFKEHWTVVFGLLDSYMQRTNPHSGHTTDELTSSFCVTVTVLYLPGGHIRGGVCTTLTRRHRTGSFGPFIFDHLPVPFDDNHRSNERNIRFLPSRLFYPKGHKATVFGVRKGQYQQAEEEGVVVGAQLSDHTLHHISTPDIVAAAVFELHLDKEMS